MHWLQILRLLPGLPPDSEAADCAMILGLVPGLRTSAHPWRRPQPPPGRTHAQLPVITNSSVGEIPWGGGCKAVRLKTRGAQDVLHHHRKCPVSSLGCHDHCCVSHDPSVSLLWQVRKTLSSIVAIVFLRWLVGGFDVLPQSVGEFKSLVEDGIEKFQQFKVGQPVDKDRSLGLFLNCKKPSGDQMGFFFGECLPNLDTLEAKFISEVLIKSNWQMFEIDTSLRMMMSSPTPGREQSRASL